MTKRSPLSDTEKLKARMEAGQIRLKACYPVGKPGGYATEQSREEALKIADKLEAEGQLHRGRRSNDGAAMLALHLISIGWPPEEAARYALATHQWESEYHGQQSETLRKRLEQERADGFPNRMRTIASKDVKRLLAQVEKIKGTIILK